MELKATRDSEHLEDGNISTRHYTLFLKKSILIEKRKHILF
jgi:hypothetical protein